MSRLKRITAFFLVFVTIFLLSFVVVSAKDNENVVPGEGVIISIDTDSAYTYWFHKGHNAEVHSGFVTSDDYSLGSPRHGTDGNTLWVYCMEFQVDGNTAALRNAALPASTTNHVWRSLSSEQQLGITLATLYGYPMSGGNADDYFAATQCIIWEFQTGVRTSTKVNSRRAVNYTFTDGGVTKTMSLGENYFYNIMAAKSSGAAAYNSLITKIYNHFLAPSFAQSKIELSYDTASGKYKKVLSDTNGVLSSYNVSCDSGVSCDVSGNTLTLTASKYINGANLTLTKKSLPVTSQAFMILDPVSGQTMLTGQTNVPVSYTYKVYALNGAIKIQKRSSDNIVAGIKFKVSGNGIDKELVTDSTGVALLSNIPVGSYTVTESAEDRYVDVAPQTVTVVGGQTTVVPFSNVVKRGDLKVLKVDKETGKGVPGAQFVVYDMDDNLIDTQSTGPDGVAVFSDLLYGSYYVQENLAPAGYLLSDEKFSFDIYENLQVVEWTCSDENLLRQFSVYKKGEVLTGFDQYGGCFKPVYEEEYLSGAKVGIFAGEDIYTVDGTKRYEKDELVETLITSSDGPVETSKLFEGVYYAKELSAPSGYVLCPAEPVEVCLFSDDLSVGFSNARQKCSLSFVKCFDDGSTDFSAVSFGLYNSSPILDLPANSLLEIIKPTSDGTCTMTCDLPCGYDYYIKEISTADGYAKSSLSYPFSFKPMSSDKAEHIVTLDPITNVKISILTAAEAEVPQTGDVDADSMKFFILTAIESLLLLVVIIIRKKKLTLYY